MNNSVVREKKISTILGLVLVCGLFAALFALRKGALIFSSKASEDIAPKDVKITNVTDKSFVISWKTEKAANGQIKFSEENGGKLFFDSRDKIGSLGEYTTHYFETDNLKAETEYQFSVISGGKEFLDNEVNFKAKTAIDFTGDIPLANLASGVVETNTNTSAQGAIVFVNIDGISPLSSLVTSSRNWAVSLSKAFSADLSTLADYQDGKILEEIFVEGGSLGTAVAKVYTEDDDPVAKIILGGEYDFTKNNDNKGESAEETVGGTGGAGFDGGGAVVKEKIFSIDNPEEGEVVGFLKPEIFGKGPSGGKVEIILESTVKFESKLTIDRDGNWRWTPPQDLEEGAHTLTVKFTDAKTGKTETFKRTFVLSAYAASDEPYFSATPSGETATPTPEPMKTLIPEPTETPEPTAEPTETERVTMPSTDSGVYKSGFFLPTALLIIASILFFVFSAAFRM